ncbi:MAG: leucine-rich repeat domain-containing protein, partial [archaeon]|nr:leucine-rich repeat domain-containing protein [archaeon]
MADNGMYLKAGAVLGIVIVVAACAVLVLDDDSGHPRPVSPGLQDQAVQQDTPEVQIATKYTKNITFKGQNNVQFTLTDCVTTANGLIFSFTNPYITPGQTPEGLMNLRGTDYTQREDVYGKFNYSVDYSSGKQVITYTEDHVRDKDAPEVPLAWICGYSNPQVKPAVLDIPAVIVYGDDEYLVYGCIDGDQVWKTASFFGKNTKLTSTVVNFHIAYDHYVIPSTFFRENPYLVECNMEYVSADITWHQRRDSEGKDLDTPIERHYHSEGYLAYIGDLAFYKCASARVLNLPDHINFMGYNCFSAMSLREFVFDTSVRAFESIPKKALGGGYCFSGNTYLEILTIGKNVDNLPANLFSKFTYSGKETCNVNSDNLRIVYNAGSRVTQAAVADSITGSGSVAKHPVYLFNLFGGDLEVPATLGTQYLTMPTVCVRDGVNEAYIPAWRVNETAEKVLTGDRVKVNSTKVLTVYNGISIATYHLGDTVLGIQDLVCDYASEARDGDSFPGLGDVFLLTHWNTSPDGTGTTYVPGQTIVTVMNLDLYAQGIPLRNEFTATYLYSEKVDGVWYDVTATGTYTNGDDNRYATDADGLTVVSRTEGQSHASLGGFTHWCLVPQTNDQPSDDIYFRKGDAIDTAEDVILRAVSENSAVRYSITYTDGSATHVSVFWSRSHTPSVVLEQVMFANGSRPFDCWRDQATGEMHRAGDTVTLTTPKPDMALEPGWRGGTP